MHVVALLFVQLCERLEQPDCASGYILVGADECSCTAKLT
jgi:hypothetical protein